jgi:hypothetical protein
MLDFRSSFQPAKVTPSPNTLFSRYTIVFLMLIRLDSSPSISKVFATHMSSCWKGFRG